MMLTAIKCPTDALSYTNCALLNESDFRELKSNYIEVSSRPKERYIFTIMTTNQVKKGEIGFNTLQRRWAAIEIERSYRVYPFTFDYDSQSITTLVLEVDFITKTSSYQEPYDSDKMAVEFTMQHPKHALTVGQMLIFQVQGRKTLRATVKEIECFNKSSELTASQKFGVCYANTAVVFEKGESSSVNLTGKAKGKAQFTSIISPEFDFNKVGIGGLDDEFKAIFRRAFASRICPPEIIDQIGMKHVRGILLYGPPGTGKTLMARQISKMLNAREPKIVNGPEILNKYVGESEANIRKLFADAEEEEKRMGIYSALHTIIFDEIDAICKTRGSVSGSTGVQDTVVNQLLSKIDGVEQLNNILVIGMTNRKDMIDEALLRPGRLEVQMEIGLPDEKGRLDIFRIHTAKLLQHNKLANDVDLAELAAMTKNFSGAEIEGTVRAAISTAINRHIKASSKVEVDPDIAEKLRVTREDFMHALLYDIHPAFGASMDELESFIPKGIIEWGFSVSSAIKSVLLRIKQVENVESTVVNILLEGLPGSGVTALGAKLALESKFPFIKFCCAQDMIAYSESAKCMAIKKIFDDAFKSKLSCVVMDSIENILEFTPIGPRFSNLVLQTLMALFKRSPSKGRRFLLIGTTNQRDVLDQLGLLHSFSEVIHVSYLHKGDQVSKVFQYLNWNGFSEEFKVSIERFLQTSACKPVGIKKLLDVIDLVRGVNGVPQQVSLLTKALSQNDDDTFPMTF